ncbi:MAG: aldehyde ferredoxin oxidoreductase family protein [Bacillota bacterium]
MARTLYVDLTSRRIESEETPKETVRKYLGGRGYAARLLFDHVGPEVDPLSPENWLIFSAGILAGSGWPAGSRYCVSAKSPATGAYGYAHSGGHFGPALQLAGYDAVVFTGRAEQPVYLFIHDDRAELRDAADLWGKDTHTVESTLSHRHPGAAVASIGQGGENLVLFASIMNDLNRAAGRSGMGTVMGSKRLKALAVLGTKPRQLPAAFLELARQQVPCVGGHSNVDLLRKYGTPGIITPKNAIGDLPAKNHQLVQFPGATNMDGQAVENAAVKKLACYACPIACSRVTRVEEGIYRCLLEGPEYETIDSLGPMVWNDRLDVVIYANLLCNQYGLDTISTGVVIAFAMELKEKGLLTDDEFSLEWGDPDTIIGLIKAIGERKGRLGKLLAQGVRQAAEQVGGEAMRYAMHVKGVELPRQEPRVAKTFGLAHTTSNRGADHLYGLPTIDLAGWKDAAKAIFPDLYPEILEYSNERYRANVLVFSEHYCAVIDALGVCKFTANETFALMPEDFAAALAALGYPFTAAELLQAGERLVNLERMYCVAHGLDAKDDVLPERFTREPAVVRTQGGLGEVKSTSVCDLASMRADYYRLRGWDERGVPRAGRLEELGLK